MAGPVYTYTLCTPDAASPMNQTQPLILGNFQAINELLQINHVAWTDANVSTNFGSHNFLSMPNQAEYPTTADDELAMFSYVTGDPNPCEIFIRYPNSGDVVQISTSVAASPTGVSGGNASQGWVTFPSGITLRWGTAFATTEQQYITFDEGTIYKSNSNPMTIGPTTSGAQLPIGIYIFSGIGLTESSTSQLLPVSLYGYSTSGAAVEFNYFIIGE